MCIYNYIYIYIICISICLRDVHIPRALSKVPSRGLHPAGHPAAMETTSPETPGPPGPPGTAEVQLVAPSGLLLALQLRIDAPAAETMRASLREAGKEAKGAVFFCFCYPLVIQHGWLENPLEMEVSS